MGIIGQMDALAQEAEAIGRPNRGGPPVSRDLRVVRTEFFRVSEDLIIGGGWSFSFQCYDPDEPFSSNRIAINGNGKTHYVSKPSCNRVWESLVNLAFDLRSDSLVALDQIGEA